MEEKMSDNAFRKSVWNTLCRIDPSFPWEELPGEQGETKLFGYIGTYAMEKRLHNTAVALPLVWAKLTTAADHPDSRFHSAQMHMAYLKHSMAVTHMLIDLHIAIPAEEEDILLAAALCHVLPENLRMENIQAVFTERYFLNEKVAEIVSTNFFGSNDSGSVQKEFYDRIRENRLALLEKLADRGNLVEQLYGISNLSARNYIYETRNFFFPMCIYGKERYPELLAPISVMMEKMRCLIEIAEILLGRFEARETELTLEILALREENAMIRGMIQSLQNV